MVPIFGILLSNEHQPFALTVRNWSLQTSQWTGEQTSKANDKIAYT
jgi:hypothetical protein